jgi:glycosyltransferase involved in cell wall biosynthesis
MQIQCVPGKDSEELRVLLLINSMTISGGAEALVLNIYNLLKTRPGIKVKLVTLKKAARKTGYDIPGIEGPLSNDPDFFDCNSFVNLSVLKPDKIDVEDFIGIVERFKPHVIHSHLFLSELVAHEITFPGIKYFSHCHDNMPQLRNLSLRTFTDKKLFTDFLEKQHLVRRYRKCNNKFISISDDTSQYFESVLPKSLQKNIFPLNNAIVTKNFPGVDAGRDITDIRIINVGRFTTLKNQQFLVDITGVLLQRGHRVNVVMLGKGEEYEHVKAKVAARKMEAVISLPGTKANMAGYYSAANVYVHVCKHEPFGLVLLEAMASGLPVISLDGVGNRGLIEQGENGFMITNEDPNHFADAIEKVIKDKTTYQAMSAKSVVFAQRYDIEEYLTKLIQLYRFG